MKKNLKRMIGNLAINLGKHAVEKSVAVGMYDPKIPDALKMDKTKSRQACIVLNSKIIYREAQKDGIEV